jgi:hypothetical protein
MEHGETIPDCGLRISDLGFLILILQVRPLTSVV